MKYIIVVYTPFNSVHLLQLQIHKLLLVKTTYLKHLHIACNFIQKHWTIHYFHVKMNSDNKMDIMEFFLHHVGILHKLHTAVFHGVGSGDHETTHDQRIAIAEGEK